MDSDRTENLYKYFDSELGEYRDIRECADDLCSLDSTAYFDKRARKKFTILPKNSIISKFWSLFWFKKNKANEGLIAAAKSGNIKKI